MRVTGLSAMFQGAQSDYRFKLLSTSTYISDGRRMWSNGRGVQIYFSKRWFPEVGVWVISNGTISLVQNRTQSTNDVPGTNSGTYGLWDHFQNNNVYEPIQSKLTLGLKCLTVTTSWPTPLPSKSPSKHASTPTKHPTKAPTAKCLGLYLSRSSSTCPDEISGQLVGSFQQQSSKFNNKIYFKGTTLKNTLFWSDLFEAWVVDGADGTEYSALSPTNIYVNSQFPPQSVSWTVFDKTNTFSLDCDVVLRYTCFGIYLFIYLFLNLHCTFYVFCLFIMSIDTGFPTSQPTAQPVSKAPTGIILYYIILYCICMCILF
ncbi:hypothetical protein RFI_38045, partial [Reticulomyxa filosa]